MNVCNSDRQKFVDPRQFREEIVGMDRLAPHERVQPQTAQENLPYLCEKVVEAVRSIPRESGQQQTAEQSGGALQFLDEIVEMER